MTTNNPTLPLVVNKEIQSAYVKLNHGDVVYTNFETSRTLTSTTSDTLYTSTCALTASLAGPNSGYYHNARLLLFSRGFEESYTALTQEIGIFSLRKRYFDTKIKEGSFTASVTGTHADDYYDSGSGELKRKNDDQTIGVFLNDEGLLVLTSASSSLTSIVQSITAIKYRPIVQNTELSVFCKCEPNEMNFTLNPSAFNITAANSYMEEAFTGSTTAWEYYPDLVSSGISWQPMITSIGLYNDDNELLAIAKLTKPLKKPTAIPITIRAQIDI